jgi:hypothetical protein
MIIVVFVIKLTKLQCSPVYMFHKFNIVHITILQQILYAIQTIFLKEHKYIAYILYTEYNQTGIQIIECVNGGKYAKSSKSESYAES